MWIWNEEDLINNIINNSAEILFSTSGFISSFNYNEENISDNLCTKINNWFNNQLSISLENANNNDCKRNNSIASSKKLWKQCDLVNSNTL